MNDLNHILNDFEGIINDAQREVILKRAKDAVNRAVNASCTCGGKPAGSAACPACMVWHRLTGQTF